MWKFILMNVKFPGTLTTSLFGALLSGKTISINISLLHSTPKGCSIIAENTFIMIICVITYHELDV